MNDVLFPNFLTDAREYEQSEAFWSDRWSDLLGRVPRPAAWQTPWLNTAFANGSPIRDGNPIFSAIDPGRRLCVRVIQLDPTEVDDGVRSWTDTFAAGEPDAVSELVISCVLTPGNADQALVLMEEWITGGRLTRERSRS